MESAPTSEAVPRSLPAPAGSPARLERFSAFMTPARAIPISILSIALVAAGDMLTGVELTFALLYKFPIAFGTWFVGSRFGYLLSVLAIVGALATSLYGRDARVSTFTITWNLVAAFLTFLLVVYLVDVLRTRADRDRREKAIAIGQLRHAERLNLIGKLAAGVAHELGTPLNVITANAELMSEKLPAHRDVRRFTTAILAQAERMTEIIRHLLEFGRRGASDVSLVDLNEIVVRCTDLIAPLVRRRGSTLVVRRCAGPLPVNGNAAEIEQVLSNLVMNAMQAMEASPGPIEVSTGLADDRELVFVRVRDSGSGIDPADMPHLFDPFFTTKGVGEGTGLGLSVSYGIIADHRGRIEVESAKGIGSCFTVLLRLAD